MTNERLRYAPATSVSLEAFAAAFTEGFRGYHRTLEPDAAKMAHMGRVYNYDLQHSLVAYDGDEVAGVAVLAIRGKRGWCGGFGVAPAFRRRGVGRALMSALLASARSAGVGTLSLEVSEHNPTARRLYECAGLRVTRDLLLIERAAGVEHEPREFEGGPLEEAEPSELLLHFARLHRAAPAWQRDLPTMLAGLSSGLRLGPRESPRAYALLSAGADGETYVTDLAAVSGEDARELTAALARGVAGHLRVLNEPEDSLFVEPLLANGFVETERQREMAIELR
ncbi:MAG TPA: GNAT family N-acetyltransferase [Pyrinomonadaceae bacterium]|nr:GNAT family N-acetyltransferase [Pyrinomonadaceae bacterium]